MRVINTNLMRHPLNWVILFLMVLLAGFGGSLFAAWFGRTYAQANSNPATTLKPPAS